jgi:bacillithiol system protein YtxJ
VDVVNLSSKKEWKKLFNRSSNDFEIIIYKYSPICNLSNSTDVLVDEWIEANRSRPDFIFIKINVIISESLCKKVEKDLNVIHESPQIIWLDKEKKVKFHASHYNITVEEMNRNL